MERMAMRVWMWKTWQRAHEEPAHIDSAVRKQRDGSWYQAHSPPFALSRTPACGTVLLTSDEAAAMSSNPHIPVQTRPGVCFHGDFTPNLDNRR